MNKLPRLLALSAFIGLASVLAAQTDDSSDRGHRGRGPDGPGHHGGPGMPIIRVLDNDQNGELSATEIANAQSNLLSLDLNGDGSVTKDEVRPARPADAPTPPTDRPDRGGDANHPHPAFPLMLALDADQDQVLSSTEIANASASLTALDANADGTLTRDEFLPTPPADAPTGRGGRGGHRRSPPVRK